MTAIYVKLALFYALAFASLAFLPRWRWLLPAGAFAFVLSVWAIDRAGHLNHPLAFVAETSVLLAALGFASGFAARALILSMRIFAESRKSTLLAALVLGPAVAYGGLSWLQSSQEARRVPPTTECLSRLHRVSLGPETLDLPLTPTLTVGEGTEFEPTQLLVVNEHARAFCDKTSRSTPALTNLSLTFEPRYTEYLAVRKSPFCVGLRPYPWWREVCRREWSDPASDFPVRMTVYVLGRYAASKMHAFSADALADMRQESTAFSPTTDGVAVFRKGQAVYFTRNDVEGYLARCHASADASGLYCVAGYRLTDRLGLIYEFRTTEVAFPERSRQVDARAREAFGSLRAR